MQTYSLKWIFERIYLELKSFFPEDVRKNSGNLQDFIKKNSLTSKQQSLIANLFKEANENNFTIRIGRAI